MKADILILVATKRLGLQDVSHQFSNSIILNIKIYTDIQKGFINNLFLINVKINIRNSILYTTKPWHNN